MSVEKQSKETLQQEEQIKPSANMQEESESIMSGTSAEDEKVGAKTTSNCSTATTTSTIKSDACTLNDNDDNVGNPRPTSGNNNKLREWFINLSSSEERIASLGFVDGAFLAALLAMVAATTSTTTTRLLPPLAADEDGEKTTSTPASAAAASNGMGVHLHKGKSNALLEFSTCLALLLERQKIFERRSDGQTPRFVFFSASIFEFWFFGGFDY